MYLGKDLHSRHLLPVLLHHLWTGEYQGRNIRKDRKASKMNRTKWLKAVTSGVLGRAAVALPKLLCTSPPLAETLLLLEEAVKGKGRRMDCLG